MRVRACFQDFFGRTGGAAANVNYHLLGRYRQVRDKVRSNGPSCAAHTALCGISLGQRYPFGGSTGERSRSA